MHYLSFIACDRPSLLFYHSHTDSATSENKEEVAQMLHLLRHVRAFLNLDTPQMGTSPTRFVLSFLIRKYEITKILTTDPIGDLHERRRYRMQCYK